MNGYKVWITGASRGLGAALVREYASAGADVFLTARNEDQLADVASASGFPDRCHVFPADVTNSDQLSAAITGIVAQAGQVDLAILNAGTYLKTGMDNLDVAEMRALFEINVFSIVAAIQLLLPGWRSRGAGTCAIIGSVAGDVGLPYAATYSASKSALRRLAESLYPEFERAGLGLHLVSPGFVDTSLTAKNEFPMPFMVSAERAAREIRRGIDKGIFDIRFPKRMSFAIKVLAALPYPLKFALLRRMLT